jgi:hypothetical protein
MAMPPSQILRMIDTPLSPLYLCQQKGNTQIRPALDFPSATQLPFCQYHHKTSTLTDKGDARRDSQKPLVPYAHIS